jgi:hypothetical protein
MRRKQADHPRERPVRDSHQFDRLLLVCIHRRLACCENARKFNTIRPIGPARTSWADVAQRLTSENEAPPRTHVWGIHWLTLTHSLI